MWLRNCVVCRAPNWLYLTAEDIQFVVVLNCRFPCARRARTLTLISARDTDSIDKRSLVVVRQKSRLNDAINCTIVFEMMRTGMDLVLCPSFCALIRAGGITVRGTVSFFENALSSIR